MNSRTGHWPSLVPRPSPNRTTSDGKLGEGLGTKIFANVIANYWSRIWISDFCTICMHNKSCLAITCVKMMKHWQTKRNMATSANVTFRDMLSNSKHSCQDTDYSQDLWIWVLHFAIAVFTIFWPYMAWWLHQSTACHPSSLQHQGGFISMACSEAALTDVVDCSSAEFPIEFLGSQTTQVRDQKWP